MVVRRAEEGDMDEILTVINESNREVYEAIIPAPYFREPVLTREEYRDLTTRMTFYVFEEGVVAGVAALEDRGDRVGQVHWVYVLPGWQRKGVGTALIRHIEGESLTAGMERMVVITARGASWARGFYRKLGYRMVGEEDTPEGGVARFERVL
jgi:N-acetylglutamate synthase-like GNAT family acetyltransferase